MTHDEWGSIFSRVELAWGDLPPQRRNYYFEMLADLDGAAVRAAVDRLALEAREFVPPPGVIRDYASRAAAAVPSPSTTLRAPAATDERPSPTAPDPPRPAGARPGQATPGGAWSNRPLQAATPQVTSRRESGKAVAALVLGLVSILLGALFLVTSILAIIFGAIALSEMKATPALRGRGKAQAGLILGIATLVLWVTIFLVAAIVGDSGSASS